MFHSRPGSQVRLILRYRIATCLILAWALVCLISCSDRGSVIGPDSGRTAALVQVTERQSAAEAGTRFGQYRRIWPHEDGMGWAYRLTSRTWDQPTPVFYPTAAQVPPFTMDDVIRLLGTEPSGGNPQTSTGSYRLQFNGFVTTFSGVTRQNLQETVEQGTATTASSMTTASVTPQAGSAFMQLLYRARPDLAKRMGQDAGIRAQVAVALSATSVFAPTLLHGYAWEQMDQWIGTYGDLNQQIAWIFLKPDLQPGAEFSLQLVPDLADDVFLHARVLGWKSVETDAGTFHRALDVAYLVDFGVSEYTDVDGNTLGFNRSSLFGTVDYVVGVGPVRSYERVQITVDFLGRGNSDETASLTGTVMKP